MGIKLSLHHVDKYTNMSTFTTGPSIGINTKAHLVATNVGVKSWTIPAFTTFFTSLEVSHVNIRGLIEDRLGGNFRNNQLQIVEFSSNCFAFDSSHFQMFVFALFQVVFH
ncbi:hypothetical protein GBAR_LOCUS23934 [Geodia barretti]|uniref:Uncharacterized protein n=1 Tax=Geodia barretti TaxID=519541 RepID=A0AA35XA18_GEOBA|nr:hypothetical protein GBAR_LOCUS23934 [Geodia barretti]